MTDQEVLKKLYVVTNQLLDLGKRNRLLNFKDSGLKTLMLLNKNIEEIFRAVKGGRDCTILNIDPLLLNYHNEVLANNPNDNILEYTPTKVYEITRKYLSTRQLLCYKTGFNLNRVLKSLKKDFNSSIIEKGINALYLSFEFIHYTEEDIEYVAPLMLLPIELSNEGGDYVIHQYEDEIIINPTLKYYFSSVYNCEIPSYQDESFSSYIEKVRSVLPSDMRMDDGAAIGIYSFYKMNMYNDLIFNKETVIQNRNIRYLLGEEQREFKSEEKNKIYPVVNCDSSQLDAIQMAADGKSFCLEGPPGSGKSQTITNIIASLLGVNKRILFVSEKISALNVVFENLRRVHLSDFAIELHSNKANKKDFIQNLYKAATAPKYNMEFKSQFIESKYKLIRSDLSSYENEMNNKIPGLGISLSELYSLYFNVDCEPIQKEFNISNLNLYDVDNISKLLNEYSGYANDIYDYRANPFYFYNLNQNIDINNIEISINHLTKLIEYKNIINEVLKTSIIDIPSIYNTLDLFTVLFNLKTYSPFYLVKKVRARLIDSIEKYLIIIRILKSETLSLYDQKILNEPLEELSIQYNKAIQNKSIFKSKELKELYNKIISYRKVKATYEEIQGELKELVNIKKNLNMSKEYSSVITKYLGNISNLNLRAILSDLRELNKFDDYLISEDNLKILKNKISLDYINSNEFKNQRIILDITTKYIDIIKLNIKELSIEDLLEFLNNTYSWKDYYSLYLNINTIINSLSKYNILDFLDTYLDYKYELNHISDTFKKTYYSLKIQEIFSSSAMLNGFVSEKKEKFVNDFRALDEEMFSINRDLIISKMSKKRPNLSLVEGSKFKILDREYNKLRRQLPIRSLLDQIFDFVLEIKPVFLMSPLSVSTYLTSTLNLFDCVIFDEASQIFASDALGSIYRGKQCIIIGDTKQMPPSNFFMASVESEDDDKEYDLESILDKATQVFPTTSLKWHYRSRSEELITFSNHSFYNDGLITIPQALTHSKGFGVDFYYFPDGKYDMATRTNPYEAQKICKMVFDHYKESSRSLGVVAFSNVQADLISSLVDKELKKHPELMKYFDGSTDEPFFVKNLETVQGDERDRIIFSICYAYNSEGKFYQRFGPLNNSGGERRLNVAVTRAKYNISIVSSIRYIDIKTTTSSKGALLLRDYLEFAEHILNKKNFSPSNNGIVLSIKKYLESLGYEVYTNYGNSSFKIDLAVKDKDKFIMAIMLDQSSNYSTNITDKYRLERLLLRRLGWKYFKLYTTAWFSNMEDEKERLYKALTTDEEDEKVSDDIKSFLEEDESLDSLESSFNVYDSLGVLRGKKILEEYDLEYLIQEIINYEAPIHEDYLAFEIAKIYDKAKPTKDLLDNIKNNIPKRALKLNGFYYNKRIAGITLRIDSDREAYQISPEEYANGILVIVGKNNGITIDGCYRTLVKLLGFDKVLASTRVILDGVLKDLLIDNKVINRNNNLYIPGSYIER